MATTPLAVIFDLEGTLTDGSAPFEGVREMLAGLTSAGYPLGVVTRAHRWQWEEAARQLGPENFRVAVTEDDVTRPKPDPQGLLRAASALGVDPASIVVVGDSLSDLAAARAAGMRAGVALWGHASGGERRRFLAEAARYHPAWLFETPGRVTRQFANWC